LKSLLYFHSFGDEFAIGARRELSELEGATVLSELEAREVVRRWADETRYQELARIEALLAGYPSEERMGADALARLLRDDGRIGVARCRARHYALVTRETRETIPDDITATELEWIEVQLIDEADEPIAGVAYRIELSDHSVRTGTTNGAGVLRYENIPGGTCKLTFPGLDEEAWEAA
jgi:hypothetical protein